MAASDSVLLADLLSRNEALTMANLQLLQEVNDLKKLQFRQEILAKKLETRTKELEDSIRRHAVDDSTWATQADQHLETISDQIEETLTRLRTRSATDEVRSPPRSSPTAIDEQRDRPGPDADKNLLTFMAMASKDTADMTPTHRAVLEEAILDCKPETLLTSFGNPNEESPVQPQPAVRANTKSSMRPESAPFIPSTAITRVKSPANVFKGSLGDSIHAVPLIYLPNYAGVNTSVRLNPTARRGIWSSNLMSHPHTQHGPVQQSTYSPYDDVDPIQIDDWLKTLTPPSKTDERAQHKSRLRLSSTASKNVVFNKRNRSVDTSSDLLGDFNHSQSKSHVHPEGSQVETYPSTIPLDTSKAKRTEPLSSVLKASQSTQAPPPLVSNDKLTERPVSTQISSLNLSQAKRTSPASQDSVNVELSDSSYPEGHGKLIAPYSPKYIKNRDVTPSAVHTFDPFSSILDSKPEVPTASGSTASAALVDNSVSPVPSAATSKSLIHNLLKPSAALTQTHTSLTEPSPTKTYKNVPSTTPSSAPTYKDPTPSASSPARSYKDLDNAKPSHILFQEMMIASKHFVEKTEAKRKATLGKTPLEDEPVEDGPVVELPEELKPTYTRVLGSALDERSKALVLRPAAAVGRLGPKSQPANRPLHLHLERVMVKLLLPSGAIKRLGHLDRPAMANAEICMHMYVSEQEATSITLVAKIHSTGNDFLVLTATQARPVLEFNVNFMLPGQLNTDMITYNTVPLNEQDDFSATSSVTSEIDNLREPITQRLKGNLRHMSFAFSHNDFNMVEQEDLPNAEDFQEFTTWDPEALVFFDFMRSFIGPTSKVITMLFTDEKNSTETVDDMIATFIRSSRNKRLWRDNGVMWESAKDANGNEKWTLASQAPELSRHL